jgi:hypothetical protein
MYVGWIADYVTNRGSWRLHSRRQYRFLFSHMERANGHLLFTFTEAIFQWG